MSYLKAATNYSADIVVNQEDRTIVGAVGLGIKSAKSFRPLSLSLVLRKDHERSAIVWCSESRKGRV